MRKAKDLAMRVKRPKLAIALLLLAVFGGLLLAVLGVRGIRGDLAPGPGEPVGLVTSLPIYWPEGTDLAELTQSGTAMPWTREALEQDYKLRPLDTLSMTGDSSPVLPGLEMPKDAITDLSQLDRLAIIQPRSINAADNVALDEWVNQGGRLLLVLDPMLTGHYEVSIFDPQHPVGSALIPPVVGRWGLELFFDESQPLELRTVEARHGLLPVVMAGEIRLLDRGSGQCELDGDGVIAHCRVGKGRVTLVADATLFEAHDPSDQGVLLLRSLAREAFE
ncbi:hypothetical protein [Altererythrobacter sp. GH1-8]|uniref:hypothetical protein n=1 Tax=Altererythrobacter sp. GH1-8 TaxID=3349333 RepID=UPI00374D8604